MDWADNKNKWISDDDSWLEYDAPVTADYPARRRVGNPFLCRGTFNSVLGSHAFCRSAGSDTLRWTLNFTNISAVNKSDTPIIAVQIARSDSIEAESVLLTVTGGKEAGEDFGIGKNFTGSGSGLEAWINSGYETSARLVNFADGEATKTVSLAIENNPVAERTRIMTLTLSGPSAGTVTGGTRTITIVDDNYPEATKLFDVTDVAYGATGDGVTDDTAAILAALAACQAADGGIVYFPDGTYMIQKSAPADTYVIPFPYSETYAVSFVGESLAGTIIKRVTDDEWDRSTERLFHTTSGAHTADCKPVAFLNMTIDGNLNSNYGSGAVHPQSHLIMFGSTGPGKTLGRFEKIKTLNNCADGISHVANVDSNIYFFEAEDVARGGIVNTAGSSGTVRMQEILFHGENGGSGYQCEDSDDITVYANNVDCYGGIGYQWGVDSPAQFIGNNVNLWLRASDGKVAAPAINCDEGGESSFSLANSTWYLPPNVPTLFYTNANFENVKFYLANDRFTDKNLFLAGTFGTAARWSAGTGWTVSGGAATHTGAAGNLVDTLYPPNSSTFYRIKIVVNSISGGTLTPSLAGISAGAISTAGEHIRIIYTGGTTTKFTLAASADCICEVGSIEVCIVTDDNVLTTGNFGNSTLWTPGTGWTVAGLVASHAAGSASGLVDTTYTISASKYYRVAVTVDSISGGNLTVSIGGTAGAAITTPGEHVFTLLSAATTKLTLSAEANCVCQVSQVHVYRADNIKYMWQYSHYDYLYNAGVQANGTFATSASWTWGGNWAHSTDKAVHTPGASVDDLVNTQAIATVAGACYLITGSLTRSAGSVTPIIGSTVGVAITATGTFYQWITATDTGPLTFRASADANISSLDSVKAMVAEKDQLMLFDTCEFHHSEINPPPTYWPTFAVYFNGRVDLDMGAKIKFLDCLFEDFDGIHERSDTSTIFGGHLEIEGGTINCQTRLLNGVQHYLFDVYGKDSRLGTAKLTMKNPVFGSTPTKFGTFLGAFAGNIVSLTGVNLTKEQADVSGSNFSSWTVDGEETVLRTITGTGNPSGVVDGFRKSDGSKYDIFIDTADGNQEYHCTGMPTTWTAV